MCRPNTYGAELTLSRSMRLHVVPPFVVRWGCWKKIGCISDVVAKLFLSVSAFSVQDYEYLEPSKVFWLDSGISNPPWTRDTVKTTEQQDTGHTDMFSCRQYSRYITVVLFGPSLELQNWHTDHSFLALLSLTIAQRGSQYGQKSEVTSYAGPVLYRMTESCIKTGWWDRKLLRQKSVPLFRSALDYIMFKLTHQCCQTYSYNSYNKVNIFLSFNLLYFFHQESDNILPYSDRD